jgi:sugar lactone lactonase YvrE/plastocyanin
MRRLHICPALFALALAVTACGGGNSGNSTPAPVQVRAAAIATQPASTTVTAGQAVTFTVAATGDALGYQWQRDGKDIAGATAASLTLNNVQASDDGASFTVVVRNSAGSVTSAPAILRVAAAHGLRVLAGALGGPGNLDGTDGRFQRPSIIAMSPAGLLYVADNVNAASTDSGVRRTVDIASGAVATVKVQPLPGQLVAMVFDSAGNRYELIATAIYKTTPAGERSLLAGAAQAGYADGAGANARFGRAAALAIDGAGNLYVGDTGNTTLRKVSPAGVVSTLAGIRGTDDWLDGSGSTAHFRDLSSLTVDRAGNIYVLDLGKLRKVSPAGDVSSTPVRQAIGSGQEKYFNVGAGIATDAAGIVYVAESGYGCGIRRIGPDGLMTNFAGGPGSGSADGQGEAAHFCLGFNSLLGNLTADGAGKLYVGDTSDYAGNNRGNQTIRRITPAAEVSTVAGRAPLMANVDGEGQAARFALASAIIPQAYGFYEPAYELAADAQGNVYVGESDRIRKVSPAGTVSTLAPPANAAAGTLYYATGLAFGGDRLAVSNGVLSRIDAGGTLHFLAGQAGVAAKVPADGTGAKASFFAPNKLIMDGLGNVYLEDQVYHNPATEAQSPRVLQRRIGPDGAVTTLPEGLYQGVAWYADKDGNVWVAKAGGAVGRIGPDGRSTLVRAAPAGGVYRMPTAITVDREGRLYVAEMLGIATSNGSAPSIVSRITAAGVESVVAGSEAWSGIRPGTPGSLGRVDALAAGADGTVYVMSENAVLRLNP